jgi:hypothetical protein
MIRDAFNRPYIKTVALILGFGLFAGASAALPPLKDQTYVSEGLISTAIAYEISDKCDTIEGRFIDGLNFLYSLRDYARQLGYSEEEIEAYMDDKVEKERLIQVAWGRFADMGGVKGDYATYCAVGEAEMAAQTQVGKLLR